MLIQTEFNFLSIIFDRLTRMMAHSSSIRPLTGVFAGKEYQDSLRYYRKEKPIFVLRTTGISQHFVGIASCYPSKIKDESDNPTFLEPSRLRLSNHLCPEYVELIAGPGAVRCRLEKPPIIAGGYQRFEIDSPVDRTHFKWVPLQKGADFEILENYIGYQVDAFQRKNINDFVDNHEQRGEEDLNTLLKRIDDPIIANEKILKGVLCDYFGSKAYMSFDKISHESELIKETVEKEKAKRVLREKDNTFGIKKFFKMVCKNVLQSIYYMCSDESDIIEEVVQKVLKEIPSDGNFKPPQDQVYINYLGDQLGKNFIPYLMDALQRRKVNVFIDNLEKRGENLDNFSKRIGGSGIAIVVFSSRYTESERVMDGLVRIVECERQGRLKVLPVFHNVPPSDVKRLKGKFGDHFRDKELLYGSDSPKIKQWKDAISYVSYKFLLAFDEKSGTLEIDFVESIVKEVLAMLQAISTVESGYR